MKYVVLIDPGMKKGSQFVSDVKAVLELLWKKCTIIFPDEAEKGVGKDIVLLKLFKTPEELFGFQEEILIDLELIIYSPPMEKVADNSWHLITQGANGTALEKLLRLPIPRLFLSNAPIKDQARYSFIEKIEFFSQKASVVSKITELIVNMNGDELAEKEKVLQTTA